MRLDDALDYARQKEAEGHRSDGCTYAPDMNVRPCCKMHDYLLRFKKVKRGEADNLLFKCMWRKGHYLTAPIYWIAVRWVAFFGSKPLPVAILTGFLILVFLLVKYA